MPKVRVVFYQEQDGSVPLLVWLDGLKAKALAKCRVKIERLAEMGHELRRPEVDLLRDGIYELRVGLRGNNYRMFYFFHGRVNAVLSHGLLKERVVPPAQIDKAVERKKKFEQASEKHTYRGE